MPRQLTQLSLVFDARVCDGGTAGGFLRYGSDCIERPLWVLAGLWAREARRRAARGVLLGLG